MRHEAALKENNATGRYWNEAMSSSNDNVYELIFLDALAERPLLNDSVQKEAFNENLTYNENDQINIDFNQMSVVSRNFKVNEEKRAALVSKLADELLLQLSCFTMEENEASPAEKMIIKIQEEYSFLLLGEVLQYICVSNFANVRVLVGMCQSLGRFDLDEVKPWGQSFLISVLVHKDDRVKEYAIALLESWADKSLLDVLKNIECSKDWMKKYIEDVIQYLEE